MSVQTEADKHLDVAKENINNAIIAIGRIVVERTYGYEVYNAAFQRTLKATLSELMEIRDKLSG